MPTKAAKTGPGAIDKRKIKPKTMPAMAKVRKLERTLKAAERRIEGLEGARDILHAEVKRLRRDRDNMQRRWEKTNSLLGEQAAQRKSLSADLTRLEKEVCKEHDRFHAARKETCGLQKHVRKLRGCLTATWRINDALRSSMLSSQVMENGETFRDNERDKLMGESVELVSREQ